MASISASMDIKEMYEDLIPVLFACIYFRHFDEFYAWDSLMTWMVFGALLFTYSYFWLLEPELSPRFIKILTVVGVMVAAHDCIYICVALCNCYRANSVGFCYKWKNSAWTLLVAGAFRFVGIFFLISCSSFGGNAHQECDQTQPPDLIILTRRRRITTI